MIKSAQMRAIAEAAGWEVHEMRLPESLTLSDVRGFPRVDVKTLIEQARRRQAQENLLYVAGE